MVVVVLVVVGDDGGEDGTVVFGTAMTDDVFPAAALPYHALPNSLRIRSVLTRPRRNNDSDKSTLAVSPSNRP